MPDMLRACGRVSLGKAGPRDLAVVRDGLECAMAAAAALSGAAEQSPDLAVAARDLAAAADGPCRAVLDALRRALVLSPPLSANKAGFIAQGCHKRLDASRSEVARARAAIHDLQATYAASTGVRSLRVRANATIGFHVEVPVASAKALGPEFTLRQGLASTTRFTTPELDRLAQAVQDGSEQAIHLERAILTELCATVLDAREALTRVARAAAALDMVCGLAQAAAEGLWSEPEIIDDDGLVIEGGRHPVAEALLEAEGRAFVSNDTRMDTTNRLWLLTGPNMAGKSTFLRQVAIITLMAQVGFFVPATRARVGVVDKMFSRIGASDDLAAGRSTFMVEMLETSAILNQATARSLVILDEVGRGTSTHDGLAIAQACMEFLHDTVQCRTLFATHFHELADAAETMPNAACMAMDASAGRHEEMFAYKVVPGCAGQSHRLNVAARAGMPAAVLTRATELLTLQSGSGSHQR